MKRQQFIYFIEPARAEMPEKPTEEEMAQVSAHFNYLKGQLGAGNLVLAGRTMEAPFIGIAIFEAEDAAAAEEFTRNDPGIAAGVFKVTRVQPYSVALLRT